MPKTCLSVCWRTFTPRVASRLMLSKRWVAVRWWGLASPSMGHLAYLIVVGLFVLCCTVLCCVVLCCGSRGAFECWSASMLCLSAWCPLPTNGRRTQLPQLLKLLLRVLPQRTRGMRGRQRENAPATPRMPPPSKRASLLVRAPSWCSCRRTCRPAFHRHGIAACLGRGRLAICPWRSASSQRTMKSTTDQQRAGGWWLGAMLGG